MRLCILVALLLALALPAAAQDDEPAGQRYAPARGETLFSIARDFDIPLACLARANDLTALVIPTGTTELLIPDDCEAVLAQGGGEADDLLVVVQRGDRLARIAEDSGADLACLVQANAIANPDLIFVGQELRIPADCLGLGQGGGAAQAASAAPDAAACRFDRNAGRAASGGVYTVQAGDSLDFIGCDFGVDTQCLAERNNLERPGRLEVGQMLVIHLACPPWRDATLPPAAPGG